MSTNKCLGPKKAGLLSVSPFLLFVTLFFASTMFFSHKISPVFICLSAVIFSFFTFIKPTKFNEKIEIFIGGAANSTVMAMAYIFIFTSVFTYIMEKIGGINGVVDFSLNLIPINFILPGLFIFVSFFATAIGSSMGTIATFLPIGIALSIKLGISKELMSGVIVSAAMLGDNLSIISDTTIAATQTTQCKMNDKFKANFHLVWPAFIITVFILICINYGPSSYYDIDLTKSSLDGLLIIKILPYLVIFIMAAWGINVLAVLVVGIFLAISIGVYFNYFELIQSSSLILEGFTKNKSIHEVLILSLFISGLSQIVRHNGGIDYILLKLNRRVENARQAELVISLMIFLINAVVAINTVAILITGPLAKKIASKFNIPSKRVASLLDIFSCVCQGIIPYAPQLLLASNMAQISSVSIIPYLHYQFIICIVAIISISRTPRS